MCITSTPISNKGFLKDKPTYKDLIDKEINIAKMIKKNKYKKFYFFCPIPTPIRWNGIYLLINSFNKNIDKYKCMVQSEDFSSIILLSKNDLKNVEFLEKVLEIFFKLTKTLESENFYIAHLFYFLNKIHTKLNKIMISNKFCSKEKKIAKSVQKSLLARFKNFHETTDDIYNQACFLSPLTIQLLSKSQRAQAVDYYSEKFHTVETPSIDKTESRLDIFSESSSGFANLSDKNIVQKYEKDVMETHLNLDLFWGLNQYKYKELYEEFIKFKTIRISNGAVERCFSLAKHVIFWKKNRLGNENLAKRIMLTDYEKIKRYIDNTLVKNNLDNLK